MCTTNSSVASNYTASTLSWWNNVVQKRSPVCHNVTISKFTYKSIAVGSIKCFTAHKLEAIKSTTGSIA